MRTNIRRHRKAAGLAAGIALIIGLVGCSKGDQNAGGAIAAPDALTTALPSLTDEHSDVTLRAEAMAPSVAVPRAQPPSAPGVQPPSAPAAPPASAPPASAPTVLTPGQGKDLVRTANWTLTVKVKHAEDPDADKAARNAQAVEIADKVRAAGLAAGGYVGYSEGTGSTQVVTLRVPVESYESVRTAISALGDIRGSESVEDVTTKLADLDSRAKSMRASLDRVRALLADAKELKDVIALESEMSRREADLESLLSQQKSLKGQATLSTITVTVNAISDAPKPEVAAADNSFVAGMKASWRATKAIGGGLAQWAGALLPWLPLVLALVLVGLWLRRRYRRAQAARVYAPYQGQGMAAAPGMVMPQASAGFAAPTFPSGPVVAPEGSAVAPEGPAPAQPNQDSTGTGTAN